MKVFVISAGDSHCVLLAVFITEGNVKLQLQTSINKDTIFLYPLGCTVGTWPSSLLSSQLQIMSVHFQTPKWLPFSFKIFTPRKSGFIVSFLIVFPTSPLLLPCLPALCAILLKKSSFLGSSLPKMAAAEDKLLLPRLPKLF